MRVLLKTIDARSDVININANVRIECVFVQSICDIFWISAGFRLCFLVFEQLMVRRSKVA